MQFLVAALLGGLLQVAGSLVGRVLLALGFAFVTYTGVEVILTTIQTQLMSNISGLTGQMVSFLAWMNIDKAISMIISAITASLLLNGITSGSISKMVIKK